ncbi:DUF302 domain-containing protein [Alkalimarinus sediminis]|uniref:DUF302 domain-containing protein n=1 Tax=Alkalimarinus sediminis TaxID=1632866 RepID=A0A9E8KPG3_9ALTE|nr:DUF302 domain-containing protein [Alkalimarinus sediminis]UZW74150.1 DUF302 domain-containing protein [Alkalimarinus sediminis]
MRTLLFCLITVFAISSAAIAGESSAPTNSGVISIKSNHDVKSTADKLVNILETKGMTVFARINHAEGAQKVGKLLRPTELVIFGNPKVGTPLMQCEQRVAIDLPQKALIWQDEKDDVWFSYNDPAYLSERHQIKDCQKVLSKIGNALANFSAAATK